MDLFKKSSIRELGPGGIYCPCCRPGPLDYTKKLLKRLGRRKLKQELKKEIESDTIDIDE